jgi:hypothetical protein
MTGDSSRLISLVLSEYDWRLLLNAADTGLDRFRELPYHLSDGLELFMGRIQTNRPQGLIDRTEHVLHETARAAYGRMVPHASWIPEDRVAVIDLAINNAAALAKLKSGDILCINDLSNPKPVRAVFRRYEVDPLTEKAIVVVAYGSEPAKELTCDLRGYIASSDEFSHVFLPAAAPEMEWADG